MAKIIMQSKDIDNYLEISDFFSHNSLEWINTGLFKSVSYKYKYDEDTKKLSIIFQQSYQKQDWLMSFLFFPIRMKNKKFNVHLGFYKLWKSIEDEIQSLVLQLLSKHSINEIHLFGWSHGGGLVQLGLNYLKSEFNSVRVYGFTIGSPRIIHSIGFNTHDTEFDGLFSITNNNDSLARLPFNLFGFKTPNLYSIGDKFSLLKCFKKLYHLKTEYDERMIDIRNGF